MSTIDVKEQEVMKYTETCAYKEMEKERRQERVEIWYKIPEWICQFFKVLKVNLHTDRPVLSPYSFQSHVRHGSLELTHMRDHKGRDDLVTSPLCLTGP